MDKPSIYYYKVCFYGDEYPNEKNPEYDPKQACSYCIKTEIPNLAITSTAESILFGHNREKYEDLIGHCTAILPIDEKTAESCYDMEGMTLRVEGPHGTYYTRESEYNTPQDPWTNRLHAYEYPDGEFEFAMNCIREKIKNAGNPYDKLQIFATEYLQKAFDRLKTEHRRNPGGLKSSDIDRIFYELLQETTGFQPNDENTDEEEEKLEARIHIKNQDETMDLDIERILDTIATDYDWDEKGRIMVRPSEADIIIECLADEGIDAKEV